jgi:CHAT domain-containing protein
VQYKYIAGRRASLFDTLWLLFLLSGMHHIGHAANLGCTELAKNATTILERHWIQRGSTTVRIALPPSGGHDILVRVSELSVDVELEFEGQNEAVGRSDSPIERDASQHAYFPADSVPATIVVKAKEPSTVKGAVSLLVTALPPATNSLPPAAVDCERWLRAWAEADMAYAAGRAISLGDDSSPRTSAHVAFERAAQKYEWASDHLPDIALTHDRGALQLSLAAVSYYELQNWASAAASAQKSAETFGYLAEPYLRARARAVQAAAWMELATKSSAPQQVAMTPTEARIELDRARTLLSRLAEFHARRHEPYEQALQINNIGLAYYYEARFELGIPYFLKAKSLFERLGESSRVALALQNIGLCEWGLGHLSTALPRFDRALSLMSHTLYPDLYLLTLNNSGLAHYAAGRFDESLRLQSAALDFATGSQADRARARSFYGMGVTYYAIGDHDLAMRFLHSALDICTPELDARVRVASLRALAVIEDEIGQRAQAIAHNSEALRLATAPSARARILLQLAREYLADQKSAEAAQMLVGLIDHPPNGDQLIRGMALVRRGAILRASGQLTASEADLVQGLDLLIRFDALADRFDAEVEFARLLADRHQTAAALAEIKQALSLSPEIRAQTANPEYRASIVQSLRPALELELDLLRQQFEQRQREGDVEGIRRLTRESLQVVDDSRAQGFEEWRAEHLDSQADQQIGALLTGSAKIYQEMAERRFQLAAREDRVGADDPRAKILREDIARLRARVGVINADLGARTSPGHLSGRLTSGKAPSLRFDALPEHVALVEYWLGSTSAFAWVVTSSGTSWISLGPASLIDRVARNLHNAMRSATQISLSARLDACKQMYRLVFVPLEKSIGAARDLVIVPDGPLHYVPFAALRDDADAPAPYIIQNFSISIAPALRLFVGSDASLSTRISTHPGNPAPTPSRILIVADPVYSIDDPRLAGTPAGLVKTQRALPVSALDFRAASNRLNASSLERLSSSAREADQIRALYRPDDVDLLEGLEATRDNFLAKDLSAYQFIHVASHGFIDSEIPQLSALILGTYGTRGPVEDAYVRAGDLLAKTFNARVVVLSACDTALGREFPSEGIIGLRYAALARGARAVVASLWPVSDGIAADLMTYMYQSMRSPTNGSEHGAAGAGRDVASSLSAAMRHALQASPTLDPALWAPFEVYVAGQ